MSITELTFAERQGRIRRMGSLLAEFPSASASTVEVQPSDSGYGDLGGQDAPVTLAATTFLCPANHGLFPEVALGPGTFVFAGGGEYYVIGPAALAAPSADGIGGGPSWFFGGGPNWYSGSEATEDERKWAAMLATRRVDVTAKMAAEFVGSLHEAIREGQWDSISREIAAVDPMQAAPELLIAFLRGAYRWRDKIAAWQALLASTRQAFAARGLPAERLLRGL